MFRLLGLVTISVLHRLFFRGQCCNVHIDKPHMGYQGRRWSDGLHQAVEAKEKLTIQNETVTLASISYQNFFLQYFRLCGMTGTAATEGEEFKSIYKLKVAVVPTNRPMVRKVDGSLCSPSCCSTDGLAILFGV